MILNDTAIATLSEAIQKNETSSLSHRRVALRDFRYDQGPFVGVRVQGHSPYGIGLQKSIRIKNMKLSQYSEGFLTASIADFPISELSEIHRGFQPSGEQA